MNPKSMLIPTAALATTMTGVAACARQLEEQAGLTKQQVAAFERAHRLRADGELVRARNVLKRAGIDLRTLESIRKALQETKCGRKRDPLHDAVRTRDFVAFQKAVEGSPLADLITTHEDFTLFVETYYQREEREEEIVDAIAEDLRREREIFGSNWLIRYIRLQRTRFARYHFNA